jgi:hypothetical protein
MGSGVTVASSLSRAAGIDGAYPDPVRDYSAEGHPPLSWELTLDQDLASAHYAKEPGDIRIVRYNVGLFLGDRFYTPFHPRRVVWNFAEMISGHARMASHDRATACLVDSWRHFCQPGSFGCTKRSIACDDQ